MPQFLKVVDPLETQKNPCFRHVGNSSSSPFQCLWVECRHGNLLNGHASYLNLVIKPIESTESTWLAGMAKFIQLTCMAFNKFNIHATIAHVRFLTTIQIEPHVRFDAMWLKKRKKYCNV